MKKKLSIQEYASVAIMLFGMFFGAGNLIFPVHLGQLAGSAMWPAFLGLLITAVGLPLLGVAALGISRSGGLYELGSQIGKPYSLFFTCLLYLTIGPFFAIPRCATTSFTVGLEQVLPEGNSQLFLLLFTLAFFTAALLFSLWPGKILTWVGRVLTPCFLVFLGILVVVALLHPAAAAADIAPSGGYESQPFFTGFLEGYNTMDALASLAFGIVVVQVIRGLGVEDADAVAVTTVKSGVFSCLLMGVIYLAVTLVGVQSRGLFETSANGGVALAQIAQHYLGGAGLLILAATVTLACLKTAVGLITSCSETFSGLFPKGRKAGIVLKPATPAEAALPYLEEVDIILVMTVEPGFGGQKFMADMMPKVAQLRAWIDEKNPACELEVDGGVDPETAKVCVAAGANVLVAGSSVYKAEDIPGRIAQLRG